MKTAVRWRWALVLLAALAAWLRPPFEDRPQLSFFATPPAPSAASAATDSLYPAPQVDPSEPPQEAAPTF